MFALDEPLVGKKLQYLTAIKRAGLAVMVNS